MNATVTKLDNHKTVLEITIPQAEVAKAVDKAYRKLASEVKVPGFRPGKAPRQILERRIGKGVLLDEAFELLAGPAYRQALDENNVEPVSRPEIEVVTLDEAQPLVFKATVTVKPEVTLGQYKGLEVAAPNAAVTDEQVDAQLETMRNRQAKMVVAEGAALAKDDFAIIDFKGFVDGEAFPGGEGAAYPLQIGSGSFIPGFEEQLIGATAGTELDVKVAFPADYHSEDLKGKDAVFQVKVLDVKRKEVPELDDEFAKEAGDFDTLADLKADIRARLEKTETEKAEKEFRNQVIKAAIDNATMDVPEIMVETRIDDMLQDMDASLQEKGLKLDQYMKYMGMDMATMRANYRETAEANVKTDLLLEAVIKAEGLDATTEEVEQDFTAMAKTYGASDDQIQKLLKDANRLASVKDSLLRKKAADLIIDSVAKA